MKKIFSLVFLLAFLVPFYNADAIGTGYVAPSFGLSTSLSSDQNTLTYTVSSVLSGYYAQYCGADYPFDAYNQGGFYGGNTVTDPYIMSSGSATLNSNTYDLSSAISMTNPGTIGTPCDSPARYTWGSTVTTGYPGDFANITKTLNVSSLANGTYNLLATFCGGGSACSTKSSSFTINRPLPPTVTASVSPSSQSFGSVSPSSQTGTTATINVSANNGYHPDTNVQGTCLPGQFSQNNTIYSLSTSSSCNAVFNFAANPTINYTITPSAGTGCTISPSTTQTVGAGSSATFNIGAQSGYQISGVSVDGASVGAVASYTFSNVNANHTISASCSAVSTPINGSCNPTHYLCNAGTSINNGETSTTYTWGCQGSNGGVTVACSETKSGLGTLVNGVCASTHYNCTAGISANNAGNSSTGWSWNCNGINGGSNASCSESVPITSSADLAALTPGPSTATAYVPQTYQSTIINYGNRSALTFNNIFQTSPSSTGSYGVLTYAASPGLISLGAGGTTAVTASIEIDTGGTTYLRACADKNLNGTGNVVESNENNNCSAWRPITVSYLPMSGTVSASNCTIPFGGSTCSSSISWSVTNPQVRGGSSVTTPINTTVGSGDAGSTTYSLSNGSRIFYLYNNSILVSQSTATASCASGTWNGSICTGATPPAPTNLTASAGSCGTASINLSWSPSSGATAYNILRSTDGTNYFVFTSTTSTSYTNTGLSAGATYYYKVQASNAGGTSPYSNAASAIAPGSCLPDLFFSPPTPTSVAIGTPTTFSATLWNQGSGSTGSGFTNIFQVIDSLNGISVANYDFAASPSTTTALISGGSRTINSVSINVFNNASHIYYLRACADKSSAANTGVIAESNENNNCSNWVQLGFGTPPPPTGFTATAGACSTGTVNLSWNATPAATSYRISRSTTSGSGYVTVYNPTLTSYTDSGLPYGTYYYVVQAINSGGSSPYSTEAKVVVAACGVPVVTITANPTSGEVNVVNPALSWSVTNNPLNCVASGDWSGTKPFSGNNVSQGVLTTIKTYTYTLTCNNWDGQGHASATVDVFATPLPDLTTSGIMPTSTQANQLTLYSATITNQGPSSTVSSFPYFFQVATGPNGSGTVLDFPSSTMSALGAGRNATASYSFTITKAGTYSGRICADKTSSAGGGIITESDENNNCGPWANILVTNGPPPPPPPPPPPGSCGNGIIDAGEQCDPPNGTTCSSTCQLIVGGVDGACSVKHYNCAAGTSVSNANGISSWTWTCQGELGGTNASCTELKKKPNFKEN